ncbi:uncharacterized protein LOC121369460 [Gigantopelta aegis]|uniref:uncharacterized protein LOC121369460 n=1 Tax=Gigantopelta aegis TaxID=1735272 RepID=UPI001B8898DF|nr:uncharacterized protein LOC121369460 [Gigantopelta aegis]
MTSKSHANGDNSVLSFHGKDGAARLASVAFGVTQDIILQKVRESMSRLTSAPNITTDSLYNDLRYIWQHLQKADCHFRARLLVALNDQGIVQVVQKSWETVGHIVGTDNDASDSWKCIRLATSLLWIASDALAETCREVTHSGLLLTVVKHLRSMSSNNVLDKPRKLYFLKAMLGLCHNVVRNHTEGKDVLKTAHGVEILKQLYCSANSTNMMLKAKSLIVLSYLVDEKESEVIHASSDTISFILGILDASLSSADHASTKYGMNSLEIVLGLNNIALHDTNKLTVVRCGAVSMYTQLLESSDPQEQTAAGNGVWCLSFVKENKLWIKEEQQCIKALRCLANKGNTPAGHAARGALWEIFRDVEISHREEQEANARHVMISYQWESQSIMVMVKDRLKQAGYKVWMDVEFMSGSTLEAMALAVEKAAVILICMTEKYKESPSCRTESEYVFRLRKDIVPLRLQHKYQPDGWLGMLVGSRLYFDFSSEELVDKQMPKLIKELGTRGFIERPLEDAIDGIPITQIPEKAVHSEKSSQGVTSWSRNVVRDWLENIGLKSLADRLTDVDGMLLSEMIKLERKSPEFFYHSLKSDFSLSFCDILKLSRGLSQLQL